MATGDPISRAFVNVNGKTAVAESVEIDPDDSTEFVEGMTEDNEPLGVSHGNMKTTITLEIPMREGDSADIDWEDLQETKENVITTVRFRNGRTHTYQKGVVAKAPNSASTGEKASRSIELMVWRRAIS